MNQIIKKKRPFIIAEIGINHNGSVELAKKLIDLAKKYNFDSVKFQKRDSDICVPEHQKNKMRTTPWGDMTYLEYRKKIEFGEREYKAIDQHCKKIITFPCDQHLSQEEINYVVEKVTEFYNN